jgi:hypothetical protein
MQKLKSYIPLFFVCTALFACAPDKKQSTETMTNNEGKNRNLNISILLDLSDRIDTTLYSNRTMHYYQRDLGYIQSIARNFSDHLKTKRAFFINDNLKVFIDPEPKSKAVNTILSSLSKNYNRKNSSLEEVNGIESKYQSLATKLYEQALADGDFVGSDIWNFFKRKVADFCIEEDKENYLILLTDGYMYHKDSKIEVSNKTSYLTSKTLNSHRLNTSDYAERMKDKGLGFICERKDLETLNVLVLGVNPNTSSGNPYEADVINEYWSNWLSEMGVSKFKIVEAYLPTEADNVIKKFLNL